MYWKHIFFVASMLCPHYDVKAHEHMMLEQRLPIYVDQSKFLHVCFTHIVQTLLYALPSTRKVIKETQLNVNNTSVRLPKRTARRSNLVVTESIFFFFNSITDSQRPKKTAKKKTPFKVSSRLLMEYVKMIRADEPSTEETVWHVIVSERAVNPSDKMPLTNGPCSGTNSFLHFSTRVNNRLSINTQHEIVPAEKTFSS